MGGGVARTPIFARSKDRTALLCKRAAKTLQAMHESAISIGTRSEGDMDGDWLRSLRPLLHPKRTTKATCPFCSQAMEEAAAAARAAAAAAAGAAAEAEDEAAGAAAGDVGANARFWRVRRDVAAVGVYVRRAAVGEQPAPRFLLPPAEFRLRVERPWPAGAPVRGVSVLHRVYG